MCNEKTWLKVLNKSGIRYFKETEGKSTVIIIATSDDRSYKYQFLKGKCIGSQKLRSKYDHMLRLFIWAHTKCPTTNLEVYGGIPVNSFVLAK